MKRSLNQASYFVGLILLIQIFLIQGTAFGKKEETPEALQTPKAMIAALNQRHVAIDQRESRMKERESQLKLLKDEILSMLEDHKKKVTDYQKMVTDYEKMVDDYKKLQEEAAKKEADRLNDQAKEEEARLDLLAKIYQSMKAKEAAIRISKLKESTGANILRRIKPKISAAILGNMDAGKAARYTEVFITGRK